MRRLVERAGQARALRSSQASYDELGLDSSAAVNEHLRWLLFELVSILLWCGAVRAWTMITFLSSLLAVHASLVRSGFAYKSTPACSVG
jgi:hypothetical protein